MDGMNYRMENGYRLPDLLPPPEQEAPHGKYALLRRQFLKQHRPVMFTNLLTTGSLNRHLSEIQQTATTRLDQLMSQMAEQQGLTEELKAKDQLLWVGMMNTIRQAAEENVLTELVYS